MRTWMSTWLGRLSVILAIALTTSAAVAPVAIADVVDQLSNEDRAAIRQTIESQIAAFKADDADLAFSFA
ncbi:MAG: hypothetical protein AAGA73_19615, partial [Pseudomonadota bacterium]